MRPRWRRPQRPKSKPLTRTDLAVRLGRPVIFTPRQPGHISIPSIRCFVSGMTATGNVYLWRERDGVTFRFNPDLGSVRDEPKAKRKTKTTN